MREIGAIPWICTPWVSGVDLTFPGGYAGPLCNALYSGLNWRFLLKWVVFMSCVVFQRLAEGKRRGKTLRGLSAFAVFVALIIAGCLGPHVAQASELTLKRHNLLERVRGPRVMIVLDGIGVGKRNRTDAVYMAKPLQTLTPLWNPDKFVNTLLKAHGEAVGMPKGTMGNSEVGHNALFVGKVYSQGGKLVNEALADQSIFKAPLWGKMVTRCKDNGKTLHLIGLLSDGMVHSDQGHLHQLIKRAHAESVRKVAVHPLLDGRDVDGRSAPKYLDRLYKLLDGINASALREYVVATVGGRKDTTMDRYEEDWSRVQRGFNAYFHGKANHQFKDARDAVNHYYAENASNEDFKDEHIPVSVIAKGGKPLATIGDGDSALFFNFRGDRAIQFCSAVEDPNFDKFDRGGLVPDVLFGGMMLYDGDKDTPHQYLVQPPQIERSMSEYLAANGIRSASFAEVAKYGHVTYFKNGNKGTPREGETWIRVPGLRGEENLHAWMGAEGTTQVALWLMGRPLEEQKRFGDFPKITIEGEDVKPLAGGKSPFDLLVLNYANGDMVGHTGDFAATRIAVQTVDHQLGQVLKAVRQANGIAVVTADHGNADEMIKIKDGTEKISYSHSKNKVRFSVYDPGYGDEYALNQAVENPGLTNVTSSLLWLMGFQPPEQFDAPLIVPR